MLGRISTVTINTPDLPATVAAYQRYLGYRVVDDVALGRETARGWGRLPLAGRRCVLMEPESGAETYLRFVQGPAYAGYEPLACVGWNAAEIIVRDVDALAERLADGPFRTIGPPANLSFSDKIRAMQVVGPAREVLYLTQIREPLAAFDTPVAASEVDRVFIVILGGASLDALQDYYHQRFGVARAPVPPSQAAPRPCDPGQLPPGIAMVTFEVERLPDDLPSALAPAVATQGLPYDGRPARTCIGATGELIELIEAG